MYKITSPTHHNHLPDLTHFLNTLNYLNQHPIPEARTLFDPNLPLIVTRAPGRLDLMGGIADYSGSLVLQLPLREATFAALQKTEDRTLHIISPGDHTDNRAPTFQMSLNDLEPNGAPIAYQQAAAYFKKDPTRSWAAYAAGTFLVLRREKNIRFPHGARIFITSNVPEAKGVSSSAALEVAVMQAVCAAFHISLEPRETALLCQKVENLVVGAPCGVMDQMSSVCGEEGRLLALLCQPAELQDPVTLPEGLAVWGLDSGIRHAVSGADYGSVRTGAFMGYRILVDLAGFTTKKEGDLLTIEDPHWNGYLANITPSYFEQHFAAHLPDHISSTDFIKRYTNITDPVTRVDPDRTYAILKPTAHPIYEHFRVRTFAQLLTGPATDHRLSLLGELMYQSHASYSACGLGSTGTDRLVQLARESGLPGAKITGGGSGGTVALLGRPEDEPTVQSIATRYAEETGHTPYLFSGSSPGAHAFGHLELKP
ncbi:MAG: GHMP kinase [bacterium]|nr:GHMP kinase [bacterium]